MADTNKLDESQQSATDERGSWAYPSLTESGHVEIELPSLPGSPNRTDSLLARNFGGYVIEKVERSLRGNPYSKSGPQQNPAQTFNHYIGAARGAKLVDERTLDYMDGLAKRFDAATNRRAFFNQSIRPFLKDLKPGRRRK